MVKTMKVDVYKELCELYKELRSEEPATLRQKLIRFKYLLKLRQTEKSRKYATNADEYGISIIQSILNSTIAMKIYEKYQEAIENQSLSEFEDCFEIMEMEYFRLKDELANMDEDKEVITKCEVRSLLKDYFGKADEEDLIPYARPQVIGENIVKFPRR